MTAGATIKLRRDTSANWATANTVLAVGEPGLDTTVNSIKYGNGTTAWNNLPYSGIVPTATGNLIPALGNTYTLGNVTNPWAELYLSGNTIYLGNVVLEATGNARQCCDPRRRQCHIQPNICHRQYHRSKYQYQWQCHRQLFFGKWCRINQYNSLKYWYNNFSQCNGQY